MSFFNSLLHKMTPLLLRHFVSSSKISSSFSRGGNRRSWSSNDISSFSSSSFFRFLGQKGSNRFTTPSAPLTPERTTSSRCEKRYAKTINGLKKWLRERGVDADAFGVKTVDDLLVEVERGETVLVEKEKESSSVASTTSTCERRVSVVVVEISGNEAEPEKRLVECEQTLASGRKRKRNRFLSEKIRTGLGETAFEATERGIREELGDILKKSSSSTTIDESTIRVDALSLTQKTEISVSKSFFGLPSVYEFYHVRACVKNLPLRGVFESVENDGTKATWTWV